MEQEKSRKTPTQKGATRFNQDKELQAKVMTFREKEKAHKEWLATARAEEIRRKQEISNHAIDLGVSMKEQGYTERVIAQAIGRNPRWLSQALYLRKAVWRVESRENIQASNPERLLYPEKIVFIKGRSKAVLTPESRWFILEYPKNPPTKIRSSKELESIDKGIVKALEENGLRLF